MQAVVIKKFGNPLEVFEQIEVDIPKLSANEILVEVHTTSVNPVDYKIRSGELADLSPDFPAVLHGDVSGIVEEVGTDVTQFKKGDKVFGCAGGLNGLHGALAEYMKGDAHLFAKISNDADLSQYGAMPLVSITAYEAIFERAKVQAGEKVLVYGGTGGVGHLGIQFAKIAGAEVYTTVANEAQEKIAKELGADATIHYKSESVEDFVEKYTDGKGFDVVFDTVGNQNLNNSFQAVKVSGRVVTTLALDTLDLSPPHIKGLDFHIVFMLIPMLHNLDRERHGKILKQVAEYVESGKIKPLIDEETFDFSQVGEAHARAESGKATGKVIITKS